MELLLSLLPVMVKPSMRVKHRTEPLIVTDEEKQTIMQLWDKRSSILILMFVEA